MSPLERVSQTRWERDEARDSYLAAIRAAVAAGESKTSVALAAGVSRPTLYKMLRQETK